METRSFVSPNTTRAVLPDTTFEMHFCASTARIWSMERDSSKSCKSERTLTVSLNIFFSFLAWSLKAWTCRAKWWRSGPTELDAMVLQMETACTHSHLARYGQWCNGLLLIRSNLELIIEGSYRSDNRSYNTIYSCTIFRVLVVSRVQCGVDTSSSSTQHFLGFRHFTSHVSVTHFMTSRNTKRYERGSPKNEYLYY